MGQKQDAARRVGPQGPGSRLGRALRGIGQRARTADALAELPRSGERAYHMLSLVFCCALVVSNVLAAKTLALGPFALPASILTFPVTYIVNDALSDVFGFRCMRRTIMAGFAAALVASAAFQLAIAIPGIDPAASDAFARALGNSGRILLGSFAAYLLGSLLNSYVMCRLKRRFERNLLFRCVLSTVLGETVDSLAFITVAFWGVFGPVTIATMIGSQVLFKTLYELAMYPLTRQIILRMRGLVPSLWRGCEHR